MRDPIGVFEGGLMSVVVFFLAILPHLQRFWGFRRQAIDWPQVCWPHRAGWYQAVAFQVCCWSRWQTDDHRQRPGGGRVTNDFQIYEFWHAYLIISQYLNLIFCPICFQAWSFTYCIPQVHKCHISTHAWYQANTASCDELTIHTFHFPFCAGEEVPPRGNLFHDSVEDEGDCRGILGFQNQRCSGTHLRSRKTKTSVHCKASATAHVVRAGSSSNFSAILLNLLQMGKSVAVRNHTSSDVSMLSQHIQ